MFWFAPLLIGVGLWGLRGAGEAPKVLWNSELQSAEQVPRKNQEKLKMCNMP